MKNFDQARALAAQGGPAPRTGLWIQAEKVVNNDSSTGTAEGLDLITIILPPLIRRRIYCHIEARLVNSAADYFIGAELELRKGGQTRALLPATAARDNNLSYMEQSHANFFPNPPTAGPNAILVQFAKSFASGTTVPGALTLSPYELSVAADEAILRVKRTAENGTATKPKIRIWLGILSMDNA